MISVRASVAEVFIFWENLWPALCSELVTKTAGPGLIHLCLFVAAIVHVLCPNTTWSLKTKEVLNLHIVHSFKVNDSILGDMAA